MNFGNVDMPYTAGGRFSINKLMYQLVVRDERVSHVSVCSRKSQGRRVTCSVIPVVRLLVGPPPSLQQAQAELINTNNRKS